MVRFRRGDTTYAIGKHYTLKQPDWDGIAEPFSFNILKISKLNGNLKRDIAEALKIRGLARGPLRVGQDHPKKAGHPARVASSLWMD